MTTGSGGSKWVGNAGLLIGLSRKSLPRDSKGFEPIEGYFDHNSSVDESDSDSSETDTEELVRQEKEKLLEAQARKKAVEDARKKAKYLEYLAVSKKQAEAIQQLSQEREEEENGIRQENGVESEVDDSVPEDMVDSDVDVGADVELDVKAASRKDNSEQLYSPNASAMVQQLPAMVQRSPASMRKLVPSRLSFSGSEEVYDHESESEPSGAPGSHLADAKLQTKTDLESTFLASTGLADTVPLPRSSGQIQLVGHISTSTESSFHPTKTSTQLKTGQRQQQKDKQSVKKKGQGRTTGKLKPKKTEPSKLPSSIDVEISDSESESERDEALEMLLASGNAQHFQGLSQLTKSKLAPPSSKSANVKSIVTETGGKKRKGFAVKSTGGKVKTNARKSVTFVTRSESESDRDHQEKSRADPVPPSDDAGDVYMSFDEDHFDSLKIFSPKKGGPSKPRSEAPTRPDPEEEEGEGDQSSDNTAVNEEERDSSTNSSEEVSDGYRPSGGHRSTTEIQKQIAVARNEPPTGKKTKHRNVRVSETPDNDSENESVEARVEPPRSILKNVPLSLPRRATQRYSQSAHESQWYVPNQSPLVRKQQSTSGGKREHSAKQTALGRPKSSSRLPVREEVAVYDSTLLASPPSAASMSAAESSESEVERTLKVIARDTTAQVVSKSKRNGKQVGKSRSVPVATSISGGNERERDVKLNTRGKKAASKPSRKKQGRSQSASSESERDEYETRAEEQLSSRASEKMTVRSKKKKSTLSAKSVAKDLREVVESSEGEVELEEWLANVRRDQKVKGGRQPQRKPQESASSESELENGTAQQMAEQLSGEELDTPTTESEGERDYQRDRQQIHLSENLESGVEDSDDPVHVTNVEPKLKKSRILKSVSIQPTATFSNQKTKATKSATKQRKEVPRKSTGENNVKEVKRRGRPRKEPLPVTEVVVDSENELSEASTVNDRVRPQRADRYLSSRSRGRESPGVEVYDGAQYGYSDDDLGAESPPPSPEPDANFSTGVNFVGGRTDDLESAGENSGPELTNQSATKSVDVSVLPRLTKRKRSRAKVVLSTHPKKRKLNIPAEEVEQETSVNHDTYSLETSGEEGDDDFVGDEITQSGGGRRYRRLKVAPLKSHTPGVRRSKRTKIAPIRHWENEQLEYDTRRRSGVRLKGLLVPIDQEEERRPKKKKKTTQSPDDSQDDREFSPLRFIDIVGNEQELPIVHTLSCAPRINCSGEPITQDSDAEVIIHRLKCTQQTSKGVMTFSSLGEKPRSTTRSFDMFFYVLKGKLLFQVNDQEFTLLPQSSIDIPGGCSYCIRNMQHSKAQVFFSTHYIEPQQHQYDDTM